MRYFFFCAIIGISLSATTANAMSQAELMSQLRAIEARLLELQTTTSETTTDETVVTGVVAGITTTSQKDDPLNLIIEIEGVSTSTFKVSTAVAAQAVCESYAYDTQYMWKQITCTVDEKIIYDDVFIAG